MKLFLLRCFSNQQERSMSGKQKTAKHHDFKFDLGAKAEDTITGFQGVVFYRSQWLNGCNTYGLQPTELKDGLPQDRQCFDEPQLILLEEKAFPESRATGGPERAVSEPNR
jgi:hypothetical protein